MLGFFASPGRGAGDAIVARVARRLQARALPLAGAVQMNVERDPARKCDMELHVLSGTDIVRISQNLGRHAVGCRLDSAALEEAVGLAEQGLRAGPALLVVNKFGKQEADGRGFRPLIGAAVAAGLPVLTSVNPDNRAALLAFAGPLAEELPVDPDAIERWCLSQVASGRADSP